MKYTLHDVVTFTQEHIISYPTVYGKHIKDQTLLNFHNRLIM